MALLSFIFNAFAFCKLLVSWGAGLAKKKKVCVQSSKMMVSSWYVMQVCIMLQVWEPTAFKNFFVEQIKGMLMHVDVCVYVSTVSSIIRIV